MVTRESLEEKYKQLGNIDLLEIVARGNDYTELAILVAKDELKMRGLSGESIEVYESTYNKEFFELEVKNGLVDLSIFKKLLFYFWWFPKYRHYFTDHFEPEGYILKSNQTTYYSVLGFACMMIAFAYSMYSDAFILVWIGCFLPVYLFDIGFNKGRQTRNIENILAKKDRPFGYY